MLDRLATAAYLVILLCAIAGRIAKSAGWYDDEWIAINGRWVRIR